MEPDRNDEGRGALRVGVVCGALALATVVLVACSILLVAGAAMAQLL